MTHKKLDFVSFEPINDKFKGFLSMEVVFDSRKEPEATILKATKIYENEVKRMTSLVNVIKKSRASHTPVPARRIWQLGNIIFKLRDELEVLGLEIDGIYDHLTRDLDVKRKWLEKVIILRRYLPYISMIPESLNWGRCEKGTRKIAERLKSGLPPF